MLVGPHQEALGRPQYPRLAPPERALRSLCSPPADRDLAARPDPSDWAGAPHPHRALTGVLASGAGVPGRTPKPAAFGVRGCLGTLGMRATWRSARVVFLPSICLARPGLLPWAWETALDFQVSEGWRQAGLLGRGPLCLKGLESGRGDGESLLERRPGVPRCTARLRGGKGVPGSRPCLSVCIKRGRERRKAQEQGWGSVGLGVYDS